MEHKQGISEVRYVQVYVGHMARNLESILDRNKVLAQIKRKKHRTVLQL